MAVGTAAAAIGGAVLGGIMGGQKDQSSSSSSQGIRVAPETELERSTTTQLGQRFNELSKYTDIGPGQAEVAGGLQAQRSLADLLKSYSQGGYQPTQGDITQANSLADAMLNPAFRDQQIAANRQAARMGRQINDPILQAKLRQGLADTRGMYVAQQAQQAPLQRLGFAQQYAQVQQGLASQAVANRQALMNLGSQLRESDRSYRIGTGERYSNQTQESGGGIKGILGGALGGIGSGLGFANTLQSMGQRQQMTDFLTKPMQQGPQQSIFEGGQMGSMPYEFGGSASDFMSSPSNFSFDTGMQSSVPRSIAAYAGQQFSTPSSPSMSGSDIASLTAKTYSPSLFERNAASQYLIGGSSGPVGMGDVRALERY